MHMNTNNGLVAVLGGRLSKFYLRNCDFLSERHAIRVSLVVSIPIIFLIGITVNSLSLSIRASNRAAFANDAIVQAIDLSYVVNRLQIERGLSAMFLGSNRSDTHALASLIEARSDTNSQLYKLRIMPPIIVSNQSITTKPVLQNYIDKHRSIVDYSYPLLTLEDNIDFYTNINEAFMEYIADTITVPSHDRWLVAFNSLFKAKDIAGIRRAIGSTYYSKCSFSKVHEVWFSSLDVQFNTYLAVTFRYHQESWHRNKQSIDTNTISTLLLFNEQLINNSYRAACLKESIQDRNLMGQFWFGNMTLYLNHLAVILEELADDLDNSINTMRLVARTEMVIYSSILIIVLVCSVITVKLLYSMTTSMQNIARGLNGKTIELESERKRMEELLNQMLPKTVADRLKMNLEVKAEFYDMVTIYFSDVVGFTHISAMLSPHQVVDLLNGLYSLFDGIIDKYDAYKVETIGDAYMVASGIPERNGKEHVRQIAYMALTIQKSSSNFIIPHTYKHIKIRSGLHSGPCASGVVGTKMPRYCLFGDTVNTASRMESTGQACRIHISSNTKALLDAFGGFTCEERGTIDVKGKGPMCTYWLVGSDKEQPKKTETDKCLDDIL